MDLTLSRHLFFAKDTGGTLAWKECSPPVDPATHKEHRVCNCTQAVTTRPEGEPYQTAVRLSWKGKVGPYEAELSMSWNSAVPGEQWFPDFTLRWTDQESSRKNDHAYFWWSRDHLSLEITGTKDSGDVNCSFGKVHFGNQGDYSRLFNGHSPSRIVFEGLLSPYDVWAHACDWGQEVIVRFEGPEVNPWWEDHRRAHRIQEIVQGLLDPLLPLDTLYQQVSENAELAGLIDESFLWYASLLAKVKDTEVYRTTQKARKMAEEKGGSNPVTRP